MKSSSKAKEEIAREYEGDPEDWHVYLSRDRGRFLDTLFCHSDEIWYLKEFSINPYKSVGLAERSRGGEILAEFKSFGLREVEKKENIDIMKVLDERPKRVEDIKSELILEGPIMRTPDLTISKAQEDLDAKLRRELSKLIDRDYPQLSYPYL